MTICTTPIEAANRYLDQMTKGKAEEFKKSLHPNVVQHRSSLNGPYQMDVKVRNGVEEVFAAYKKGMFDTTSNYDVRKWALESNGSTVSLICEIDQDKAIPGGLNGRYRFKGNCRFDLERDSSGDLKIKEIWDASEVIKLS